MSSILREIQQVKEEMDKLVGLALNRHATLSDSRHYKRLLQLNAELERLYRELAYTEPFLYRHIMEANAIKSAVIYRTYAVGKDEDEKEPKVK